MSERNTVERLKKHALVGVGAAAVLFYAAKMVSLVGAPERRDCADIDAAQLPAVVMYGTSWCQFCLKTRWFLEDRSIDYCEYDIEQSALAGEAFRRFKTGAIPVTVIAGSLAEPTRVDGFNEQTLAAALQRQGLL